MHVTEIKKLHIILYLLRVSAIKSPFSGMSKYKRIHNTNTLTLIYNIKMLKL